VKLGKRTPFFLLIAALGRLRTLRRNTPPKTTMGRCYSFKDQRIVGPMLRIISFCNEKAPEYAFKGFIFGGSGEIRTRDQRIKRSHWFSKPYINQWSKAPKIGCAIGCAITSLVQNSNL
jgi:hypothetical protein